jgi:hypothetical protein
MVRFRYPGTESYFYIPNGWWDEAGMQCFELSAPSYSCDLSSSNSPIATISLSLIQTPHRNPGVDQFQHDRMINILKGIRCGAALPPVDVMDRFGESHFILRDGFHRFHASIATGLTHIPAAMLSVWEPEVPSINMPSLS